jgi:hypothetical protein
MLIDALELGRPYTAVIANQYCGNTQGRTLQSQDINWLLGLWSGQAGACARVWISEPRYPVEVNDGISRSAESSPAGRKTTGSYGF